MVHATTTYSNGSLQPCHGWMARNVVELGFTLNTTAILAFSSTCSRPTCEPEAAAQQVQLPSSLLGRSGSGGIRSGELQPCHSMIHICSTSSQGWNHLYAWCMLGCILQSKIVTVDLWLVMPMFMCRDFPSAPVMLACSFYLGNWTHNSSLCHSPQCKQSCFCETQIPAVGGKGCMNAVLFHGTFMGLFCCATYICQV